jgi:hypothetical protein
VVAPWKWKWGFNMGIETPFPLQADDHLFEIAYKRMANLPGELMELSYWANKVSILSFNETSQLSFKYGAYRVSDAHHRLLPAFAALGLGLTGKALGDVLHHHGAGFDHVTKLYISYEGAYEEGRNGNWILRSLMNAIFEHPDLVKGITPDREYLQLNNAIDLALLKAPFEHLWPITDIERYIEKRRSGVDPEPEFYCPRPLATFDYGHQSLAEETDEQILTLLHRAGALFDVPEAEFDLNPRFFLRFFESYLIAPSDNLKAIIRALNSIEDVNLLRQIEMMIVQSLSNREWYENDDHRYQMLMIVSVMDPLKYQHLHESMVLKLNLLSVENRFLSVETDANTYLQCLRDELMRVKPCEFRAHHFRSLSNIAKPIMPPQITQDFDLASFLCHILEGLAHQQSLAMTDAPMQSEVFRQAQEDAEAFVRYASTIMVPDYARLKDLPSESKHLLAANGFDIKKLSGMSHKHRGELLFDAMGL